MQTDDDPWAGARTAARADVKSALARGVRTCPACGAEQRSGGRFCDACGADMTARHRKPPKWRTPALIVLGLLVFTAAVYPLARVLRDDAATERERTAQREAALKAEELARLRVDARPVRAGGLPLPDGADPVAFRARQLTHAEGRIAADGRRRAEECEHGHVPRYAFCTSGLSRSADELSDSATLPVASTYPRVETSSA